MRLTVYVVTSLAVLAVTRPSLADQIPFTLLMDHGMESFSASVAAVGPTTDPSGTVTDAYHVVSGTLTFTSTRYPEVNGVYSLDPRGTNFLYPNGDAVYRVATHNQIVRSSLDGDGLSFISSKGAPFTIWGSGLLGIRDIVPPTGTVWNGSYGFNVDGLEWDWGADVTLAKTAPEPGSLTLISWGAIGLAGYCWRRRKQGRVPGQ